MKTAALLIDLITILLLAAAVFLAPLAVPKEKHEREVKEIVVLGLLSIGAVTIAIILTVNEA